MDGTQYLLYDGHGSTRQLADNAGNVIDSYGYDAYGVMLGGNPTSASPAATNLLYSGEHFDSGLGQYYLRARNYDPLNGRFTTLDPYSGNTSDPQSLHKYTYCHNDPINAIDPSGEFSYIELSIAIGSIALLALKLAAPVMTLGRSIKGFFSMTSFTNMVRTMQNHDLIDWDEGEAIKNEAQQAALEMIQSAVGALADIAQELAEQYIYSVLFAGVTKAVVGVGGAVVKAGKEGLAVYLASRPEKHHLIFKCAVKFFRGQRTFKLPHSLHVGAPEGLHYRILQHPRFYKIHPAKGRPMREILKMGKGKWLAELGECYKWLENEYPGDYKGIYECYQKAVKSIGGASGLI